MAGGPVAVANVEDDESTTQCLFLFQKWCKLRNVLMLTEYIDLFLYMTNEELIYEVWKKNSV